jgi:two-component system, NarL family, nitrate/nitrite response regulator NarL
VLLVDDHPIVHQGVERLIESAPDILLCGTAVTAAEGARVAAATHPHVVLLDLHLPDMSAPDAAVSLRSASPGVRLILFTGDSRRTVGHVAELVGVDGVVHKDNACATLITAIREVRAGRRFSDPLVGDANPLALSRREFQVLQQLAKGDSNAEIARRLGLTSNTVKSYVQTLLARLDARNRLDAVLKAQRAGVL